MKYTSEVLQKELREALILQYRAASALKAARAKVRSIVKLLEDSVNEVQA